ncbi:DUF4279 domain-containing protein [Streptomyces sp. NPDC047971]|uniref:DUF4279 domain-containing protein n=1 Tax=Streptomyces sp. NPDC047971 TaxID=3154499 RepID=UPI003401AB12
MPGRHAAPAASDPGPSGGQRRRGGHCAREFDDGGATNPASVHHGPGWWAYTLDERFSDDLGEQIATLTARLGPLLGEIEALTAAGCFAQVSIAGTVRANEVLTLSPESAERLAALGLPVSFTTLLEGNAGAEDPLDWLG